MKEKLVQENILFDGYILKLHKDIIEIEGKEYPREYVEHAGGAGVLVIDGEYTYLVKQYRHAVKDYVLEICAGKLEKGKTPLEIAKQELEEELGLISEDITHLIDFYPSVGYTNEIISVFITTNHFKTTQKLEDGEYLDIVKIKITDVYELIKSNEIKDAKTIIAFNAYKDSLL